MLGNDTTLSTGDPVLVNGPLPYAFSFVLSSFHLEALLMYVPREDSCRQPVQMDRTVWSNCLVFNLGLTDFPLPSRRVRPLRTGLHGPRDEPCEPRFANGQRGGRQHLPRPSVRLLALRLAYSVSNANLGTAGGNTASPCRSSSTPLARCATGSGWDVSLLQTGA